MIAPLVALLSLGLQVPQSQKVSNSLTASGHFLEPIGRSLVIPARPVDMVLHPNGKWLYVKENRGLTVVDTATMTVVQELAAPGGASHTGIALNKSGDTIYFSNAASTVHVGTVSIADGKVAWARKFEVPKPKIGGEAFPCGLYLAYGGDTLFVASSRANEIVKFNTADGKVLSRWETDIAPYDIAMHESDEKIYVSCWGGKRPPKGAKTAPSSGTPVEVDDRGIVKGGTVAIHSGVTGSHISVRTGLQPSEIVLGADGRAFVANANHDSITEISANLLNAKSTVVKPNPNLPFGSAPNALAIHENKLYVACGGSNAIAILSAQGSLRIDGFLPTGWYPSAVQVRDGYLYVANAKGIGSRRPRQDGAFHVYNYTGTVQKIALSDLRNLSVHTAKVNKLNATEAILKSRETERHAAAKLPPAVPVPTKLGAPSTIQHVVYVIKENRTYDQLLGDIEKGDGDPRLCIFGRQVTPNHHALAEQFVLLDNYYCNGINSADGHAWSVEGNATSHFERSFGGWTRSYPFGDDPLAPSTSGFLWDNVLRYGKTFRNYGEFDYAESVPKGSSWKQIWDDWKSGANKIKFTHNIGIERLRRYSHPGYPGWNMKIPDTLRAKIFMQDLKRFEKSGHFPNMTILYLPQDHTEGTSPGEPTPRAFVADNDLALGQCVEALSKTKFWKKMAIFVIEDDPQDGWDHVDGHRSVCLVISPYTRTGKVISKFYNQTSVLATMQRILGVPPMNQMDARSQIMYDCFVKKPNYAPYKLLANRVPLNELNPRRSALKGEALKWADASLKLPRHKPDLMDAREADLFNRAIWFAMKGTKRYPSEWAGAHGKGLKKKKLTIDDDEDEEGEGKR